MWEVYGKEGPTFWESLQFPSVLMDHGTHNNCCHFGSRFGPMAIHVFMTRGSRSDVHRFCSPLKGVKIPQIQIQIIDMFRV